MTKRSLSYFLCWKYGTRKKDGVRLKASNVLEARHIFATKWDLSPADVFAEKVGE